MFAYPLTYDLVAATPEEKSQVKLLVDSIVGEWRATSMVGELQVCHQQGG